MSEITKEQLQEQVKMWVSAQRKAAAEKSRLDAMAMEYTIQEGAPLGSEVDYTDCEIKQVPPAPPQYKR